MLYNISVLNVKSLFIGKNKRLLWQKGGKKLGGDTAMWGYAPLYFFDSTDGVFL